MPWFMRWIYVDNYQRDCEDASQNPPNLIWNTVFDSKKECNKGQDVKTQVLEIGDASDLDAKIGWNARYRPCQQGEQDYKQDITPGFRRMLRGGRDPRADVSTYFPCRSWHTLPI